jgi:hypothetical protein
MKKIMYILTGLVLMQNLNAQYLGWKINKINRSLKWDCICPFTLTYSDKEKAIFESSDDAGLTKITFYFDDMNRCSGYTLIYDSNFEDRLSSYVSKSYSYNNKEDYYENKNSYLFYQASSEIKMIHVVGKVSD